MSRKPEKKSGEGAGRPEESYVYDFLYYDARRIGSFEAQLGSHGALKGVKHHIGTAEETVAKAGLKASGGVPAALTVEKTDDDQVSDKRDESLDSEYDPFWISGLNLYIDLDKHKLLRDDISKAGVSDFVVCSGALRVLDGAVAARIFQNPTIVANAIALAPPTQQLQQVNLHEMLKMMPPVIQAHIGTGQQDVWMTLSPDGMIVNPNDLSLKHDVQIAGKWSVLGIVDALPDAGPATPLPSVPPNDPVALKAALEKLGTNFVGLLASANALQARELMGRARTAYGITPLMIFRSISRH